MSIPTFAVKCLVDVESMSEMTQKYARSKPQRNGGGWGCQKHWTKHIQYQKGKFLRADPFALEQIHLRDSTQLTYRIISPCKTYCLFLLTLWSLTYKIKFRKIYFLEMEQFIKPLDNIYTVLSIDNTHTHYICMYMYNALHIYIFFSVSCNIPNKYTSILFRCKNRFVAEADIYMAKK